MSARELCGVPLCSAPEIELVNGDWRHVAEAGPHRPMIGTPAVFPVWVREPLLGPLVPTPVDQATPILNGPPEDLPRNARKLIELARAAGKDVHYVQAAANGKAYVRVLVGGLLDAHWYQPNNHSRLAFAGCWMLDTLRALSSREMYEEVAKPCQADGRSISDSREGSDDQ